MAGLTRPNPLDGVKGAHFGAENMGNHVASVNQHPICIGQAFDPCPSDARILELADNMVGDSRHMTVGAARRHNDRVGKRAFASQINTHDIFSLVFIERGQDQILERIRLDARDRERFCAFFIFAAIVLKINVFKVVGTCGVSG
jgi:hypothetical protein